MEAQWREIEAVNARVKPFRVLRGVEVNIRADGSLDVDDEVLAELDWVVASMHTAFERSPTERILGAIDNPHVDCIGHLTGRRILTRTGAEVDIERIVARAAETGTALEINSQPDRLDMRDTHARLAGEAGVLIPVTTDAHSTTALGYAELGIGLARRAWLTKEQVLNTRTWAQIAEAPASDGFREDGAAAVDWVASYLERVSELPVLSQVEPGDIRAALPFVAAGRARAVLRRAPRPRRRAHAGAHALAELRASSRTSPTTASEPGVLAELLIAGLNQVGILWRTSPALQELEEVTLDWLAQLLGLPSELHGHIEDTASTGVLSALAVARAHTSWPPRRALLRARALRSPTRPRSCSSSSSARSRSTTSSGCGPSCSSWTTPARSSRPSGRPAPLRSTPFLRSPTRAKRRASGCTSTPPTPARRPCVRSSARSSRAGSGRTRSA